MSEAYKNECFYETELHSNCNFKISEYKASLNLFQKGSINLTSNSVKSIKMAVEKIYAILVPHSFSPAKLTRAQRLPVKPEKLAGISLERRIMTRKLARELNNNNILQKNLSNQAIFFIVSKKRRGRQ